MTVELDPCPVCGFGNWPEGGMHAARDIHIRAHERKQETMVTIDQLTQGLDPPVWTIREGVGLVLPLDGQLIEFNKIGSIRLDEIHAELAAAWLRVALRQLERYIAGHQKTWGG